jgi:uncharacterized protein (DUF1015 family)
MHRPAGFVVCVRVMARIRPFRGLRYDLARAGSANDLLAPPYDVVDDAGRAALAARSPHNCVHLILPEGEGDAKYAEGARRFQQLVRDALVKDAEPGLYVYHQTFRVDGQRYVRKGFVCLIELTPFGEGSVRPHERTLAGPKVDRLNLMRACDAHLELVFGMFSDPAKAWEAAVAPALGSPVLEADFDDVHHALHRVADSAAIEGVVAALADKPIYIADGHHRYETMCAFRRELEAAGRGETARYGMIYLSNLDDEGLVVLPTHRLVHDRPAIDLPRVLVELAASFDVRAVPLPSTSAELRTNLATAAAHGAAFGLAAPGEGTLHVLSLRADFDPTRAGLGALAPALQRLDVVLLHELVLERALGISKEAMAAKTNLEYFKSTDKALDVARAPLASGPGALQLVCFMNATPVADVVAVCDSGEVMPQKSTFFVPKIPTGLVFHDVSGDA